MDAAKKLGKWTIASAALTLALAIVTVIAAYAADEAGPDGQNWTAWVLIPAVAAAIASAMLLAVWLAVRNTSKR